MAIDSIARAMAAQAGGGGTGGFDIGSGLEKTDTDPPVLNNTGVLDVESTEDDTDAEIGTFKVKFKDEDDDKVIQVKGFNTAGTKSVDTELDDETTQSGLPSSEAVKTYLEGYGNIIRLSMNTSTYVLTVQLKHGDDVISYSTVDLPIESMVVSARYDADTKKLILVLQSGQEVEVPISQLISGLVPDSRKIAGIDLADDINVAELQTALNVEDGANKTVIDTSISSSSTDTSVPSSKAVKTYVDDIDKKVIKRVVCGVNRLSGWFKVAECPFNSTHNTITSTILINPTYRGGGDAPQSSIMVTLTGRFNSDSSSFILANINILAKDNNSIYTFKEDCVYFYYDENNSKVVLYLKTYAPSQMYVITVLNSVSSFLGDSYDWDFQSTDVIVDSLPQGGVYGTISTAAKYDDVGNVISTELDNKVAKTDITTSVTSSSTDMQVPSAKTVYTELSRTVKKAQIVPVESTANVVTVPSDSVGDYSAIAKIGGKTVKMVNLWDMSAMTKYSTATGVTVDVDDDDVVTVNAANWTINGYISNIQYVPIEYGKTYVAILEHLGGRCYKKDASSVNTIAGFQSVETETIGGSEISGTASYSKIATAPDVGINVIEYTPISSDAKYLRLALWSNGTTGGGSVFDNLEIRLRFYEKIDNTVEEYVPYGNYLWNAPVDKIVSSKGVTEVDELSLTDLTRNLPDYGCSAGNVYNYIDFERGVYVHNVTENKHMEDWNWQMNPSYKFWYNFIASDNVKPNSVNVICGNLNTAQITTSPYSIAIGSVSININLNEDSSLTVNALKEYLTGTSVVYELNTPEEIPLSNFIPIIKSEANGNIEFHNEHSLDVPNKVLYKKEVL